MQTSVQMSLKFFVIPIQQIESAEGELNQFLSSHRVLSIEKRWVEAGTNSFWSVSIDYLTGNAAVPKSIPSNHQGRIDYRDILSPEDFVIFSQLREVRKVAAQTEGVPVFQIFSNAHLAKMAQSRPTTLNQLQEIDGVGNAKVAKYGARILAVLTPSEVSRPDRETLARNPEGVE